MKKFKRLASALAALTLVASLAIPTTAMFTAFAESPDGPTAPLDPPDDPPATKKTTAFTLTVGKDLGIKDNKVYATKIFDVTFAAGSNKAETIEWAADVSEDIKDALAEAVKAADGATASDIAIKIAEVGAEKVARALANVVEDSGDATGTYADGTVTFADGLEDGYYLFTAIGTKEVLGEYQESMSLGMLTVVNGEADSAAIGTGTAKIGLPTVEKKVEEDDHDEEAEDADTATYEDDAHWNDNADLEIGQTATFGLYGTLPENYADYDNYYYEFIDELSDVFEEPDPDDFEVTASNAELKKGDDYTVTVTKGNGVYNISVKFANLKTNEAVDKGTVITVKYTTALTDKAEAGKPYENEVSLKYSNNPNKSGEGEYDEETEETPKDKTAVYTYEFQFKKTFWNAGSDLTAQEIIDGNYENLTFDFANTGLKFRKTTSDDSFYGKYDYVVVPEDYVGETVDSFKLTLVDKDGNRKEVKDETPDDVKEWQLVVRIKGLDSDEYQLTETTTGWEGYDYGDLAAEEAAFNLESGIELSQELDDFEDIDSKWSQGSKKDQEGYLEIQNKKGTSLPSTGGIGTTLFYVVGGALVTVAGVTLITKKRVGDAE